MYKYYNHRVLLNLDLLLCKKVCRWIYGQTFLKDQTEMLFLFIKDYHRVQSQKHFEFGVPTITEEISDWINHTWTKYQVNLLVLHMIG